MKTQDISVGPGFGHIMRFAAAVIFHAVSGATRESVMRAKLDADWLWSNTRTPDGD